MKKQFLIALLTLFVLPLLGATCDPADKQLLIDFAKLWAQDKGYLKEDGSPDYAGVGFKAIFGDKVERDEAKAALDAGLVAKNIKDSEEAAGKGQAAAKAGDLPAAENNLNNAVKIRPGDWSYRNQRAVIRTERSGTQAKSDPDFDEALKLACANDDSRYTRGCTAMWKERTDLLHVSTLRQGGRPRCAILDHLYRSASVMTVRLGTSDPTGAAQYKSLADAANSSLSTKNCVP